MAVKVCDKVAEEGELGDGEILLTPSTTVSMTREARNHHQ